MINFMMNNRNVIGVLSIVGMFAVYSNSANAAFAESTPAQNNLSIEKVVVDETASKEALSVSREEIILEKYKNAHSLNNVELKELLWAVGFRGFNLKEAWAIAKRESNGRPLAFNGNLKTGDNSYGLFQINMLGSLGPERRDKFELKSNAELFNPVLNAQIAHYMTGGGKDWSSWKGLTPRAKQLLDEFPN